MAAGLLLVLSVGVAPSNGGICRLRPHWHFSAQSTLSRLIRGRSRCPLVICPPHSSTDDPPRISVGSLPVVRRLLRRPSFGMLAVAPLVSRAACILWLSACRLLPHQVLVPTLILYASCLLRLPVLVDCFTTLVAVLTLSPQLGWRHDVRQLSFCLSRAHVVISVSDQWVVFWSSPNNPCDAI